MKKANKLHRETPQNGKAILKNMRCKYIVLCEKYYGRSFVTTNQVYIFGYIYYNYHYFGVSKYSINLFKLSILGSHFRPPVTFALRADLSFVKMPRQTSLVVVTVRSKASCSRGFFFSISTIPLRICKLLNHKHLRRLDLTVSPRI